MKLPFSDLVPTKKLEFSILVTVLIIIFKIVFPIPAGFLILLVNEFLVLLMLYFSVLYTSEFTRQKKNNPISLIINAGILGAVLFFITALSSSIFETIPQLSSNMNLLYSIISLLIAFIFVASITYIFTVFKELFFLKLKKENQRSFTAMTIFFTLTFITAMIPDTSESPNFIGLTFFVVSIVLISINSFRVTWIAFLSKKQKISLLIISTVLAVLFGLNFSLTYDNSFLNQMLENFSPGLHLVLRLVMIYGTIYSGIIFFTSLFHLPTAEAFDQKVEEASSLMDLSRLMTQVFDFKELADTITTLTTKVGNSDSAWLVTISGEKLNLSSVSNIGYVEADEITQVLFEEGILNPNELITFNRKKVKVKIRNDIRTYDFRALAITPLKVHNTNNGFLFAARTHNFGFEPDEKKSIEAFADYAAVALENAKLIEESIEKERLKSELNVAREIQYKILPAETPSCDELDVSALFIPAFEVGGDYYDFFKLEDDKLGFVVADVSGKGISAAFIMAEVKGIFESLSKLISSPKELLIKANKILSASLEKKSFVTAVYGIFDKRKGSLSFARAGHVPVYFCRNNVAKPLLPPGIGLGLNSSTSFNETIEESEIYLKENDFIVLFTDGITEARNMKLDEFGSKRLEKVLTGSDFENTEQLKQNIMNKISSFAQGNSQHDDITLVLFKWKSNNKPSGVS